MRRAIAGLVTLLLLAPIVYDVGGYRFGPRETLCRRMPHSNSAFWGDGDTGEEVDVTGSSDHACGPCDETFHRFPRLVLSDVDSAPTVVEPCRFGGA